MVAPRLRFCFVFVAARMHYGSRSPVRRSAAVYRGCCLTPGIKYWDGWCSAYAASYAGASPSSRIGICAGKPVSIREIPSRLPTTPLVYQ